MILAAALAAAAQAAAPAPAEPALAEALAQGAAFCEASLHSGGVQLPSNAIMYVSVPRRMGAVRPLSELPELVQRFSANQTMGRVAPVSGAVKFTASEGEVWAVNYDKMPACDLMVTNGSNVPELAAELVRTLDGPGAWDSVRSAPASAEMPLANHLLRKPQPEPDDPNYGLRVSVRWPVGTAADRTGVQLQMNYLAGTLRPLAAAAQ
jgi:hypothetical protein